MKKASIFDVILDTSHLTNVSKSCVPNVIFCSVGKFLMKGPFFQYKYGVLWMTGYRAIMLIM